MPDGFSDPGVPNTKGRRDPRVAAEIARARAEAEARNAQPAFEAEPEEGLSDVGEVQPDGIPLLLSPGDIIMAKRSSQVEIDGYEHWFQLGIQTRVREGENVLDAFGRVDEFVNSGVIDLVSDAEEGIRAENERRREEEQRRPITPRRNRG
jgi:hypothetical protein